MISRPHVVVLAIAVMASLLTGASCATSTRTPDIAGSEQAADVIRTFEGRGVLADGSRPTPAAEALTRFRMRDGMAIELVAAEPKVEQPLFLTWDSRGRLWVVQYRQYQFPAGVRIVEYDDHLRARFDRLPLPPPQGVRGNDIVSVFEDTDGDGRYDTRKDVLTGLNIATSVAVGAGGIWVANPPYLLFYPDADGDDVPDGDPVVKLSGFGIEDTHAVMNSLTWGPDGWLYGANGSTTTGRVQNPATGETVVWQGQMIWRFDPRTERFEIFAEGGGNTFSLEIDAVGQVFSGTNTGRTRGMFYPQGSYGTKAWGKHGPLTNPYAFGYFDHMPHQGDDRRFPQALTIYEDALFPAGYARRIIAPNALHNVVWTSRFERHGSTWRTVDEVPLVESDDHWFRPVYAGVGPDGAVYMADWYDSRLSHVRPVDDWHKTSGRVYRVVPEGQSPRYDAGNLTARPSRELIALFAHPSRLVRRRAVLELGWRRDTATIPALTRLVEAAPANQALEALWALNLLDGLSDDLAREWLSHTSPNVRRWVVRLVGDRGSASTALAAGLASLAVSEPDVQVRVQLAASAKRLPPDIALPILDGLTTHGDDVTDPHQPLMVWWALERHAESGRDAIQRWTARPDVWRRPMFRDQLASRLMRRYAMAGGEANLTSASSLLDRAPDGDMRTALLDAVQVAFDGVPLPPLPPGLSAALDDHARRQGESGLVLRLRRGDESAIDEARAAVLDTRVPTGVRTQLIRQLGETGGAGNIPTLLRLLALDQHSAEKRVALQTLARFDDMAVAQGILARYGSTLPAEHGVRTTAERVLAGRPAWASMMLDAVDRAVVKSRDVSPDVVQLMLAHGDPALDARIRRHWPRIVDAVSDGDLAAQTARIKAALAAGTGAAAAGEVTFATRCASCHTLFDSGGTTGPDLTGYERQNLDFWIPAIIAPGLDIREGYEHFVASMQGGRIVAGVMAELSPRTVTLRDPDGQVHVLDRQHIVRLEASPVSPMPAGLVDDLSDQALRDLFAYLMGPSASGVR
jgi:putative membrane-bound dehydrogenase-like protein